MGQKRSNCIFKTQKNGKKYILNILEQFRESFNFEKKKRPTNLQKVQKFLPKVFFQMMLVVGNEMYVAEIKLKKKKSANQIAKPKFF